MIAVSEKWLEYAANGGVFHVMARLINSVDTLDLTDDDFMENSVGFEDATSPSEELAIGAVVTNTFSATLNNFDGKFNSFDLQGAEIRVQFGAEYEDGTSEYIYRGTYTIDAPSSLGATIDITGYDLVELLNKRFDGQYMNDGNVETITYPIAADKLVKGLADYCSLPMTDKGWRLPEFNVPEFVYEEQTTIRQVVSWVLQCCGGFGRMGHSATDTEDYFVCEWYHSAWGKSTDYDGGTFSPWNTTADYDGGSMWVDAEAYDGGTLIPTPRDFSQMLISADVNTQDITFTGVRTYVYGTVDDPETYFIGDEGYVVEIRDNPMINNSNKATIASKIYKHIQDMTFAVFNASVYGSPDIEAGEYCALTDYLGNTRITLISNLDYSIGGACSISIGAETPELAQQDTVSETQATINTAVKRSYEYINAKKISADAIEGGTLTLGGMNNINGSLKILDASGNEIGKWDNSGAQIIGSLYMTGGSMAIETDDSEYNFIDLKTKQMTAGGEAILRALFSTSGFYYYCRTGEYGVHIGPPRGVHASYTSGYIHVQDPANGTADVEIDAKGISCRSFTSGARETIGISGETGNITCVSLTQTSKEESKENIVPFESRGMKKRGNTTALDLVNSTDIYEFNYKGVEDDTKHYGVIIDGDYACCNEIKAEEGVDTYSMVSVLWQAVKELTKEIRGNNENDSNSDKTDKTGDSTDTK